MGSFYLFYLFCCYFFKANCVLEPPLLFQGTILSYILKFCDMTIVEYELDTQVL